MVKSYKTRGTCSREIRYEVEDGIIKSMEIIGGCQGNLAGIQRLVVGLPVELVIERFEGVDCGGRGTSCPDQIAKALKQA